MLVERTWSRFRLATTIDFDAIPLAIEIPPEDLHRVRQPDYVLPKRGQKDKFTQLLDRIPEFSLAPPNETKASAVPGPASVEEPRSRTSQKTETNTDLSALRPDKPLATSATDVQRQLADFAPVSYIDDRDTHFAEKQIPRTNDSVHDTVEIAGPENRPVPMRPTPGAAAPPQPDFESDFDPAQPKHDAVNSNASTMMTWRGDFDPAEHSNDSAGALRPPTVNDLTFTLPGSQTTTTLPTTNNSFHPAERSEPAQQAATVAVSDNETGSRFVPPFPQFAETLPPTLSTTTADALKPTTATAAATKTEEKTVKPVRSADEGFVTVVAGDTLWDLTERVYGDGRLFRAVFAVNETALRGNSKLRPGTPLRFPAQQELVRRFPELIPADLLEPSASPAYQTAAGDSLFSIARDELGQASRYLEIMELNRDVLPANLRHSDELPIGLKLILPNR